LQVFGAVFARKLDARKLTPHEYLRERVLDRAGVQVAKWRRLSDGTYPLPTGASLRAEDWLAYGRFVIAQRAALAACFEGSVPNARYGLGWWLGARGAPPDLVYASGSAGQALYLVPSLDLAVVHFGKSPSYRHEAFLKRLFA
jgi:CubicO group peptidase (beta-lactamase class C family)